LKLTANDKICLTESSTGFPIGHLAAVLKNAQVVIPSPEPDASALDYALKIESCNIVGNEGSAFKRV